MPDACRVVGWTIAGTNYSAIDVAMHLSEPIGVTYSYRSQRLSIPDIPPGRSELTPSAAPSVRSHQRRYVVRKVVVGLLGAAMVTSVGVMLPTVGVSGAPGRARPRRKASQRPPVDDLPNPLEDKRRALREQASATSLKGEAQGREAQRQHGRQGRQAPTAAATTSRRSAKAARTSTSSSAARRPTGSS